MQSTGRLNKLKKQLQKHSNLLNAPEEVQNVYRLAALLVEIKKREDEKGKLKQLV